MYASTQDPDEDRRSGWLQAVQADAQALGPLHCISATSRSIEVNGGDECDSFDALKNSSFRLSRSTDIEGLSWKAKNFRLTSSHQKFPRIGFLPALFEACRQSLLLDPDLSDFLRQLSQTSRPLPLSLRFNSHCRSFIRAIQFSGSKWQDSSVFNYPVIKCTTFSGGVCIGAISPSTDEQVQESKCSSSENIIHLKAFLTMLREPDSLNVFNSFLGHLSYEFNATADLQTFSCEKSFKLPGLGVTIGWLSKITASIDNGIPVGYAFKTSKFNSDQQQTANHSSHSVAIIGYKRFQDGKLRFLIRNSWGNRCASKWNRLGVECRQIIPGMRDHVVHEDVLLDAGKDISILKQ
jgi:hypothetical protein